MNPCPRGIFSPTRKECLRTANEVFRYQKISGPLMDRIDIQLEVPRIPAEELRREENSETMNQSGKN